MATEETNIGNEIALEMAPLGVRLFKNVRGLFLTLDGKRKVKAGLQPNGSGDYIGFTMVKVTPDMVGKEVPIFTSLEIKTTNGRIRDDQVKYANALKRYGCYAGIARNTLEAKKITNK